MPADAAQPFVVCSVLEFGDGGEPSVMLLGRGTRKECERIADLIPAVTYSGDRHPITESYMVVTEAENVADRPASPANGFLLDCGCIPYLGHHDECPLHAAFDPGRTSLRERAASYAEARVGTGPTLVRELLESSEVQAAMHDREHISQLYERLQRQAEYIAELREACRKAST